MLTTALVMGALLFGGDKVVINEFSYDDSSTDDREYVELYNPTNKDIDISGWKLIATDTADPDNNADYTIPANTTLQAGKFYVIGAATVPNVNQVVGVNNLWENSQESLELEDADGNTIDSLVYEANKGWPAAKANSREGEGVWGNFTAIEGRLTAYSRVRDGYDTNNNRDFRLQPATPGATNNLGTGLINENFDSLMTGGTYNKFGGTWADVFVVDPATADANNPNAIALSPQGGKAAIFWDKTGGGNHNMLLQGPSCSTTIEAFVYFDAKLEAMGFFETWSLGVGTTGTFYNTPDPGGTLMATANGNTGVSWTYQVTDTSATLYLIDHNDGGWGATAKTDAKILGKIDLKEADTGWHRLRLEVSGDTATGYFQGTYGSITTGQKITGKISAPALDGVYVGYREFIQDNSTTRPFTCDRLRIIAGNFTGDVDTSVGKAVKTTKGTPRAGTNGCPAVGNSSFAVTGNGLVPSGISLFILGPALASPIDLSAVAQKCTFLYVNLAVVLGLPANAEGDTTLPLPIPNNASLRGVNLNWQIFSVDPAVMSTLPVGNSRLLSIKIG